MHPCAALPKAQRLVAAALHLPHHEDPERNQQDEGHGVENDRRPVAAIVRLVRHIHVLVQQELVHILVRRRNVRAQLARLVVLERAFHLTAGDRHLANPPLIHLAHELREAQLLVHAVAARFDDVPEQDDHADHHHPENCCFYVRVHSLSRANRPRRTRLHAIDTDAADSAFDSLRPCSTWLSGVPRRRPSISHCLHYIETFGFSLREMHPGHPDSRPASDHPNPSAHKAPPDASTGHRPRRHLGTAASSTGPGTAARHIRRPAARPAPRARRALNFPFFNHLRRPPPIRSHPHERSAHPRQLHPPFAPLRSTSANTRSICA